MSSGERAKPPGSYEERNPFDVSRRPHTEVATEIAKRMAAWKQARGRSSSATPGSAPVPPPAEATPSEASPPHVSAPVQPARMPEFAGHAAQEPLPAATAASAPPRDPTAGAPGRRAPRAPFFASFSMQRAMPPAPSPKHSSAPATTTGEGGQAANPADAPPTPQTGSQDPIAARGGDEEHSEFPGGADALPHEPHAGDTPSSDAAAAPATSPAESRARDVPHATASAMQDDSVSAAEDADAIEARRAEARAIKARWMSAHALDDAQRELRRADATEGHKTEAAAAPEGQRQAPDRLAPEVPHIAPAIPPIEKLEEMSGRREPTFAGPAERNPVEIVTAAARAAAPDAKPTLGSRDGRPGGKEAMRDATAEAPPEPRAAAPAATKVEDGEAALETPHIASAIPPVDMLDELSGRREPTFDEPAGKTRKSTMPPPAASEAKAARAKRRIELPTMQTRIEARRVAAARPDPLRADPRMAVHRPIFPRIEPEPWQIPPTIGMPPRRQRQRHGTGWAIGLGAVLLIIGLTAPAAILRQEREQTQVEQDQAAMNPAPLPPHGSKSQLDRPSTETPAPSSAQATLPTAPEPQPDAAASAVPDGQPPDGQTNSQANTQTAQSSPPMGKPEAGAVDAQQDDANANPRQQAALGPVRRGEELNEAPVSSPPPWKPAPPVNLASRESAEPSFTSGQSSPMVARPFVPEQASGPFLRTPTVGAATVPIDGAVTTSQSATGSREASVGLGPSLIPQLKPATPAARTSGNGPREFARKPKPFIPQSLDQMFQTLVDTLGEGKPANPATKPIPPSTRR